MRNSIDWQSSPKCNIWYLIEKDWETRHLVKCFPKVMSPGKYANKYNLEYVLKCRIFIKWSNLCILNGLKKQIDVPLRTVLILAFGFCSVFTVHV